MLKSFEYVIAVAEHESISAAAEALGIAQPSLSRYLVKIEKELGVEFFDRSTIPLQLTEAGKCYVTAGQKMIDLNRQMMKQLGEIKSDRNRLLRIGTGPSRAPAIIPRILRAFGRQHPKVRVSTEEARTSQLADQLSSGNLDLIITFLDASTASFGMRELFDERVSLAVHQSFLPLVEAAMNPDGTVRVDRLEVPFISLHEGQQLRNALDILTGGRVQPIYDSEYLESAMSLVKSGFGATLAPSYWQYVDSEAEGVCYFPIAMPEDLPEDTRQLLDTILNRKIGIFFRKEQFLSETEKDFIICAREACAVFSGQASR